MVGLKLEWHERPGKQGSKLQVGLRGSEHQLMRQKLPKDLLWPRFPAGDSGGHDTEDSGSGRKPSVLKRMQLSRERAIVKKKKKKKVKKHRMNYLLVSQTALPGFEHLLV